MLPGAPDLTKLDAPALVEKLADPSLEVRRLATNELVDRADKPGGELLRKTLKPDRFIHGILEETDEPTVPNPARPTRRSRSPSATP